MTGRLFLSVPKNLLIPEETIMEEMIAFCGLNCTQCAMFIATQNDDDKARAEAARMLDETYGFKFRPEEINCDGCHTENGRLLGYCNSCKVRACGKNKGLDTCASCNDQPCKDLADFHNMSSRAKSAFELLLKNS